MDRGALHATAQGVAKSQTQLNSRAHTQVHTMHISFYNPLLTAKP